MARRLNQRGLVVALAPCLLAFGLLAFGLLARAEEQPRRSPLAGQGLPETGAAAYTPEELAELGELEETVTRFEKKAAEYREATRQLIEHKYKQKRDLLFNSYESLIVELEGEQRRRRETAVQKFEAFLEHYPDDLRYTPDAMFRLSELYFERSYDAYFMARQRFDSDIEKWDPDSGVPEPPEPMLHYEPTIAMMQRLITEFPDYRLVGGAYYLLGYCLAEQGEEERAVDVYQELVARRPNSRFTAEVWTRIGEYYFDYNELERALDAYSRVLDHPESVFYDKAIYKLAWTHYRLADPETAPHEFQAAVDNFVRLLDFNESSKASGKERGRDLRPESIQYMAISYADEAWGGMDKLLLYFQEIGPRRYEREVLTALGDVYFDQTRFKDAVAAYRVVQERFPDDGDAPAVQEKIVTAFERDRDFEAAALARAVLTQKYLEDGQWFAKNKDDEKAVQQAKELTSKSLYSAALFHHRQAQIHKEAAKVDLAKEEYGKAAKAYGDYLERFPHDKQLYELTFYHAESLYYSLQFLPAAAQYTAVRDSNADDKFQTEAAFSVVLSHEKAIQVAEATGELEKPVILRSSERPPGVMPTPREIPELKLKLVAASDVFAKLSPDNDSLPQTLYKAAETYYAYDHLEEARRRFQELLQRFGEHKVAEYASNLIIESHMAEKDFAAVESFSRALLERPKTPGRKEFASELVKFKTGAMFKLAEGKGEAGKYEEAAELYLKLIEENPKAQFADSALNNAAVAFEKVKRYDSASRLYERLVNEYPKSPMADTALFRVGLNAERFFDFKKAIEAYVKLVRKYPKSERRADAIYNSALSLENTQQYEKAAKQYLRYCQLFPTRDDAPEVCFRAGLAYGKMKAPKKVISSYQAFIKKYRRNQEHQDRVIEAYLKIAEAYEKLRRPKEAKKRYQLVVREYNKRPDPKSAPYAARAQFELFEPDTAAFRKMKIKGNGRQQKRALLKKAKRLKEVETSYKAILRFKQIDWTLASLFRIGQLYQNFAETLFAAPCPPDVKREARRMGMTVDEVCMEYRILIEEKAVNIEDKAVMAYETTINRARDFQVVNKWTKSTRVALNKLRRSLWPLQKEAKQFIDAVALGPPPVLDEAGKVFGREPQPPAAVAEGEGAAGEQPGSSVAAKAEGAQPQPGKEPPAGSGGAPSPQSAGPPVPPGQPQPQPLRPAPREPDREAAPKPPSGGEPPPLPPPLPPPPSGK